MVTMSNLLECGVHFGHKVKRWNPKMKKYIFGERKGIYVIDLQKTLKYFKNTIKLVEEMSAKGDNIMFVGTKKQASNVIREAAIKSDSPFVSNRWLGGMLTNFKTIKKSIRKLKVIEEMEENGQIMFLTKKERLLLIRKKDKLENYLEGVKDMQKLPDAIFVIDPVKEHIAVLEARKIGIKVISVLDTNCDPDLVDYPIPGNDDAIRSIQLFCNEISDAITRGRAIENEGQEMELKEGEEPTSAGADTANTEGIAIKEESVSAEKVTANEEEEATTKA